MPIHHSRRAVWNPVKKRDQPPREEREAAWRREIAERIATFRLKERRLTLLTLIIARVRALQNQIYIEGHKRRMREKLAKVMRKSRY